MARYELTNILERLNGTASAAQPDTATGLAEFILPFITQVGLLKNVFGPHLKAFFS